MAEIANLCGIASDSPRSDGGLLMQFQELVRRWKKERGPTSSAKRMADHPAYRAIVGLGKPVVPLLLAELQREPDHWFIALHELTGAEPVPEEARGRIEKMTAAWVEWGRKNGVLA
jgi:hypothetical protein